jgi:hypothetical protein
VAVEDAGRNLVAAASGRYVGPDVLSAEMLATLGAAAWTTIRQSRAELASLWNELERCSQERDHEAAADQAIGALSGQPDGPGPGRWRHVELVDVADRGCTAIELSDHDGLAAAAASVAAARVTDDTSLRWAEPVRAGPDRSWSTSPARWARSNPDGDGIELGSQRSLSPRIRGRSASWAGAGATARERRG